MVRRWRRTSGGILAAIVFVGLAVRLWGLTFGLPLVLARPDELLIIGYALEPHKGHPNPKFFDYPTLYLYVLAGLYCGYYAWGLFAGRFHNSAEFVTSLRDYWEPFFLIGRTVSALLGTATIVAVHATASALFGTRAALLSAFFMAVAFLHVRDSHYGTTDVPMTFFVTCAMLAIVRVHRHRQASDARLAGILAGIAMGTKYSAVLLAAPMIVVEALHAWPMRHDWRRVMRETHLFRMAIPFLAVFLAGSPYLILDHEFALVQLKVLHEVTAAGMTPSEMLGRGWTYHLPYSLWYGLGWPLLLAGLAGLAWMFVRAPREACILASFPLAYYAVAGAGYNVFVRYMIPVVPFLCIFAGSLVWNAAEWLESRTRLRPAWTAAVLALAVVAPSAWSVMRFDTLLAEEDSRLAAGRWMLEHAPAGSTIYMSGNRYGHLQLERGPVARYRQYQFDYRAGRFDENGQPAGAPPDWIVVQRSELPYSHIPDRVVEVLRTDYELVHTVRAAAMGQRNFYDIQDGFYLPFGGFSRVVRAGPNIEIYRLRGRR